MKEKINKSQFLQSISKSTGYSVRDLKTIFAAMEQEMVSVLVNGDELSLTGFGVFSIKQHKGHPVQFEAKGKQVKDYAVLKFTPSGVFMSRIRQDPVTVKVSGDPIAEVD
jgi:nucleoid DNA-binding protein